MGLKNIKDDLIEERNKAQEEQQGKASGSMLPPNVQSMMSKASSMTSMSPSSMHIPSSLSNFHV